MLWSLIKIVVFVAMVAAITLGLGYLIEADGTGLAQARITLAGVEYTLTPLLMFLGALVLIALVWLFIQAFRIVIATLHFINGDETALSRHFHRNRERKGYEALSEGMMALASGEGRVAIAKAQRAEKYLHKPELTDLVTAQAAEMMGDRAKAEEVYKRLLKRDSTRFVGIRGIMKQKLAAGETDTALQLAERAFAIKPKHEEVQDTLLRLQAEKADWAGARQTLSAKLKHGSLPRDVYKRRDAVLALSQAAEIEDRDESAAAAEKAIEANRNSPDLVPAAAMAARHFIAQKRPRNAVRVLKKAWESHPHPDLAAAFAAIEPNETPDARIKRFVPLTRINPEHRETKLLLAELNLAAEHFPEARRALGQLVEKEPDARVLAIMAAIEKGEGAKDQVIRGWLAKAVTAPRGPQWVCENCNTIHGDWRPTCTNCGAFDTLAWKTPPQSEVVLPAGANMLPLIIGALEDKSAEVSVAEDSQRAEVIDISPKAAARPEGKTAAEPEDAELVEPGDKKDAS
ncbi:tetratricopeptide repeat protein [Sagittula sp. NFXS13]|uniref:HemY protein n=1 Tax=Sagittula marina TaxID=943940 RepID=A0A7W6GVT9_9RHOB|nr:heme biosynthesis HemY N-terminal domain-containing protein [Sagittula marina]MBB3987709.1 HemY protein [Sagittula marina]